MLVLFFEEGKFYPFSDIDVVVDGLDEDYLKTLAELEEILERNVDLIEMRNEVTGSALPFLSGLI
ncbi:MAG: hypothetical protein ACK41Q_13885 [Candidatus Brocadia sp.]